MPQQFLHHLELSPHTSQQRRVRVPAGEPSQTSFEFRQSGPAGWCAGDEAAAASLFVKISLPISSTSRTHRIRGFEKPQLGPRTRNHVVRGFFRQPYRDTRTYCPEIDLRFGVGDKSLTPSVRGSLRAQRLHHIDACSARRGHHRRDDRNRHQHECGEHNR